MARYTDHDKIAAAALQLAEEIREIEPLAMYRRLALQCARDPERMAQIIMCLSAFVDDEEPVGVLAARVEAIATARGAAVSA